MEYIRASSVDEAIAAAGSGAAIVAGGTNLVPDVLFGRNAVERVVDISRLDELRFIESAGGRIRMGALATVTDLLGSDLIQREATPLHESAVEFAAPLVRNRATVAGNIMDASPAADLAPPLLAQDADVELTSAAGRRTLPLCEFFLDYRKTAVRSGELVTAISIRPLGEGGRAAYCKLQLRRAMAISVVSVAVALWMNEDTCVDAGIGLGAAAAVPYRAEAAEEALRGRVVGEAEIDAAADAARESASPIDDVRASVDYRRKMCGVLVRRMLRKAMGLPEAARA
ncbi:MAG TPA: xanthine dehydrogenase family protein subunit M [Nitrospinae bacterium]|nr:xanthine dehydrogenase family protein subunit M [Nitrospinota bacterium]